MKIWITGIAGFLGSHLADALIADGHEVYGNDSFLCADINNILVGEDNKTTFTPNLRVVGVTEEDGSHNIAMDCRDFVAMRTSMEHLKPDVLVHCAATAHEGLSNFSPSFITKNIYEASVATFSAAIAAGVKRIVFMSSMARYGHGHEYCQPPFRETMPPAPVDPYGIAKVAAEDTLKALCKVHGVQYAIAVPHNIIGIRQRSIDPYRNVAAIMINRCKQGKPPIIYGDGEQKRCFSPVADCIPSLLKMIDGAADGEVINIGPDNGEISIKQLADIVCELTGSEQAPIHMAPRPNEVKEAYCSSDKARRLLGYEPKQTLTACLKEMVDYIQPAPFVYDFPLEIMSEKIPKTWSERLM